MLTVKFTYAVKQSALPGGPPGASPGWLTIGPGDAPPP